MGSSAVVKGNERTTITSTEVAGAVEEFLQTKQVIDDCTAATIATYRLWLDRLIGFVAKTEGDLSFLVIRRFLATLQERGLGHSSRHQAFRTLKTWTTWCANKGIFPQNFLEGMSVVGVLRLAQFLLDAAAKQTYRAAGSGRQGQICPIRASA